MAEAHDGSRKDELTEAALAYVLDHGVIDLTLRPLARELGTSDRMLLYHFGSRDALLEEVLERANDHYVGLLRERVRPAKSPGAAVLALWRLNCDPQVVPYMRLWVEGTVLALRDPDRWQPFHQRVTGPWLELSRASLEAGGLPPARAKRLATLVCASLDGLLEDYLVTGERARVDAAVRDLARFVDAAAG